MFTFIGTVVEKCVEFGGFVLVKYLKQEQIVYLQV